MRGCRHSDRKRANRHKHRRNRSLKRHSHRRSLELARSKLGSRRNRCRRRKRPSHCNRRVRLKDVRQRADRLKADHQRDDRPNPGGGLSQRDDPKPDRLPKEADNNKGRDNKKGRDRPRDAAQADLIATSNSNCVESNAGPIIAFDRVAPVTRR